ncbi:MAG: dTMP kinase [bacterium]
MKGIFITVEGIDGVGKTTQLDLLHRWFVSQGYQVLFTREPGGTKVGEGIREALLNREHTGLSPVAEALLYAASRAQLVQDVIIPALAVGRIVVCDRFLDSSIAYQGFGRGLPVAYIEAINSQATKGIRPDLTLLLDMDIAAGRARLKGEGRTALDRLEGESLSFYHRVREGYLQLAQAEPERIKIISAQHSIAEVNRQVIDYITKFLGDSSRRC